MSNITLKPSVEANFENFSISGIIFATADDLKDSNKESETKTDIWIVAERLYNLDKSIPIPTLEYSNWRHWYQSIGNFMALSQTSVVFLECPLKIRPYACGPYGGPLNSKKRHLVFLWLLEILLDQF
ncbi:hypothetical protein K3495_g10066 [Podosphaera aphanis]|nr:hypothetical protein K3495_g10066 [Podosphaera aphanis]